MLDELGLSPNDSIVIGSGILSALGLRQSKDIDVVTTSEVYAKFAQNSRFAKVINHDREILVDDIFEIGTGWSVLGKDQTFSDLSKQSVVIDGVRYITIESLLAVKKSWLADGNARQKDIDDVVLIEKYLGKQKTGPY